MEDWLIYLFILIGVAVGYLVGNFRGVVNGYTYAKSEVLDEYPIMNIEMFESDNAYNFIDMATGEFIMRGTIEQCIEYIHKDSERKIVFSKGTTE